MLDLADECRMIEDLSSHVDNTQSRLSKVTRTLNDFIRKNEGELRPAKPLLTLDTRSSWCIAILIVILIILLILVVLV